MQPPASTIFRAAALRHYVRRSGKSVYLKLPSSRAFIFLWLLCGLLSAGGLMLSRFIELPVYATGVGVVIERADEPADSTHMLQLRLCFPPEELRQLRPGQRVFLHLHEKGGETMRGTLHALGRQTSPPRPAMQDCGPSSGTGSVESEAAALILRPSESWPEPALPSVTPGNRAEVRVETGSRRLTSMIPVFGNLFHDDKR